jgi:non-specific serine/threonine protein kinase
MSLRLPAERSSFVGRRRELSELHRLVGENRLLTLVGTGGVGKTRLGLRLATDVSRSFPEGTALADMSAVRDPAHVAAHVAAALDVRDISGRWPVTSLAEVIADRHVLLLLDNCEHLRDPCSVLADGLLAACPHLTILATSRQPLDLFGETVFHVPPLPSPATDTEVNPGDYDAVRLLIERARSAVPTLRVTQEDHVRLGEICRRLDGLPLAIELAAVRLRALGPEQVAARLDDRFRLLRRAGSGVPERHRTLQATLQWSHDLLSGSEQLAWRRISVFAGQFDLAAADEVCTDTELPTNDLLDLLSSLVDASVLEVARSANGSAYRLLETVRAFGLDRLAEAGELKEMRARHVAWCVRLAISTGAQFLGPDQVAAFDALAARHAELSAVLDHSVRTPADHEAGLIVATNLWLYWQARGHVGAARRWLETLVDGVPPESPHRARGLAVSGFLALSTFDPAAAMPSLERARTLAESTGDEFGAAFATQFLGQAALFAGDSARALDLLHEAAERYSNVDRRYRAFCLVDAGISAWLTGPNGLAEAALLDALQESRGGDPWTRAHALWGLGLVRLTSDQAGESIPLLTEALALMRHVDDRSGVARCVEAIAWVTASQGEWDRAARLFGASAAVWRSIPADLPEPLRSHRAGYVAGARDALGQSRWTELFGEGSSLNRPGAVALAMGDAPEPATRGPDVEPAAVLTPRQQQVAALVTKGLTDREIAQSLVISTRTAEYHVEQILIRLGFRSRVEIAAWTSARQADSLS